MNNQLLHIIMIGPQGSGKGTQASLVAGRYGLAHIETGKIFRKIAAQPTPLGKRVRVLMNQKGALIPDATVNAELRRAIGAVPQGRGIIFDGYPRTVPQATSLDTILRANKRQLTHVFYIPISRQTTIKRLALRWTCQRCNRIFIRGVNLPAKATRCPVCGGAVYQRADDTPAAIIRRLAAFQKQTKPVIRYYLRQHLLIKVDGEPPIAAVGRMINRHLPKSTWPTSKHPKK